MKRLVIGLVLLAAPALAERIEAGVTDVTPIHDGEGNARILFRTGPSVAMGDVAVRKAWIRWDLPAGGQAERLTLQVHPVTTPWDPGTVEWGTGWGRPGGDFDSGLYGRREVMLGADGEARVDVTGIFKEILEHGYLAQGFVLTVDPAEGRGISEADLERLGQLAGATLEVQYRRTPPIPRAARQG